MGSQLLDHLLIYYILISGDMCRIKFLKLLLRYVMVILHVFHFMCVSGDGFFFWWEKQNLFTFWDHSFFKQLLICEKTTHFQGQKYLFPLWVKRSISREVVGGESRVYGFNGKNKARFSRKFLKSPKKCPKSFRTISAILALCIDIFIEILLFLAFLH